MERRLPNSPSERLLTVSFLYHFNSVFICNLPKTGKVFVFLLLVFLCCKQQGGDTAYLQTLQQQHDTYLQKFQEATDALQKQSDQIKTSTAASKDTTLTVKIAGFDKKLGIYRERYTISLDRYQQLIKRFETSAINRTDMMANEASYVADFRTYEDVFKQLGTYLNELSVERAAPSPK